MLISRNPTTGAVLQELPLDTPEHIQKVIEAAHTAWESWRTTPVAERSTVISNIGTVLRQNRESLALLITQEMGKPITQAKAEIEKSAACCDFFAQEAVAMLQPQTIATEATTSEVRFEPLGVILGVMPWNFPLWQVIRAAIPALTAGNAFIYKHASNVPQTAKHIEALIGESLLPKGLFSTLLVNAGMVEPIIANPMVNGITLTGSVAAGKSVAAIAGAHLKKTVMELGGSDPFIVLADAPLASTVAQATQARLQNNSQSCIAAKRFVVHESLYEAFVSTLTKELEALVMGDPHNEDTRLGPLVSEEARQAVHGQVTKSLAQGAKLHLGGHIPEGPGYFYPPTLVTHLTESMPVWAEETFGPVFPVVSYSTDDELLHWANHPRYGLGASIWTGDTHQAEALIPRLEAGNVFVNGIVKSDPRLPFGGTKESGYGRELSVFGIREFTNPKTVWIK